MAAPQSTSGVSASGKDAAAKVAKQRLDRNVHELAALIVTEAGGQGPTAETAVGWVVLNRMRRNKAWQWTRSGARLSGTVRPRMPPSW